MNTYTVCFFAIAFRTCRVAVEKKKKFQKTGGHICSENVISCLKTGLISFETYNARFSYNNINARSHIILNNIDFKYSIG